jgi:adenine-specific DNA-methyltransferase
MNKQSEIEKLKAEVERLKRELKKRKKYGLVWEDKPEEVVEMCKEKLPVLKEIKDKEIITDKDKPVNLLIEGDNYHALSVLNYTHAGKVDVIYIDPPYNTGNKDFIFNDHYVDREDAYRHSKWLSFMEKRLKLAKNLLKDTGVIFISIDDNEVAQLKLLCDEIFGYENYVACAPRKTGAGSAATRSPSELRKLNDFVLIFRVSDKTIFLKKIVGKKDYDQEDEYGKFTLAQFQASGSDATRRDRPNMWYPIYILDDEITTIKPKDKKIKKIIFPKKVNGEDGRWLWSKDKFEKDKGRYIYFDGD